MKPDGKESGTAACLLQKTDYGAGALQHIFDFDGCILRNGGGCHRCQGDGKDDLLTDRRCFWDFRHGGAGKSAGDSL